MLEQPRTAMESQSVSDEQRFEHARARFRELNAADPVREIENGEERPRLLLQAERLAGWILRLDPHASEALRLAATAGQPREAVRSRRGTRRARAPCIHPSAQRKSYNFLAKIRYFGHSGHVVLSCGSVRSVRSNKIPHRAMAGARSFASNANAYRLCASSNASIWVTSQTTEFEKLL